MWGCFRWSSCAYLPEVAFWASILRLCTRGDSRSRGACLGGRTQREGFFAMCGAGSADGVWGGCLPLGVAAGAVDESGGAHTRMRSWGKRPGKAVSAGKAAHTRVRCADSRDRGVVCGGRWRRLSGVVRSRGEDFFAERFVGTTGGAVRLFTRGVTHICHRSQRPGGIAVVQVHGLG